MNDYFLNINKQRLIDAKKQIGQNEQDLKVFVALAAEIIFRAWARGLPRTAISEGRAVPLFSYLLREF